MSASNRVVDVYKRQALLELKTLLEENGFFVIGAAAFITRHSIFPQVATDRPDENDLALIRDFTRRCAEKLHAPVSYTHLDVYKRQVWGGCG